MQWSRFERREGLKQGFGHEGWLWLASKVAEKFLIMSHCIIYMIEGMQDIEIVNRVSLRSK